MAESVVSIANRALQLLGAKRISALDQDHPNARSMNTAYVPVRDALLRKYTWNFAITRASVAADATDDAYEGLKRYRLPNDFARLLRETKTSYNIEYRRDWQIENGFILTGDSAPLEFRYVAKVTDPALHDPLFDELLAAELALAAVHDVTGSNVKKKDLRGDRAEALAEARRANAFENDSDNTVEDSWVSTMRSNGWQTWD